MVYNDKVIYKSKVIPKIVTFADGTDEEIGTMLAAHYKGYINIEDYWHVGDTRKIHLKGIESPNINRYTAAWSEQDINIVITALNHHDLKENIGIRSKAAVTVQTKECINNLSKECEIDGTVYINLSNDKDTIFTKWSQLPLRTWLNETFLTTCFSIEMQNMIKETKHNRLTQYNTKTTEEVLDKIFFPSYTEIFGNVRYDSYLNRATPASEEGTQWDYYKTASNRIKKGNNNGSANNTSCYWFMGSASSEYVSEYGYYWCRVLADGSAHRGNGTGTNAIAPAFCL